MFTRTLWTFIMWLAAASAHAADPIKIGVVNMLTGPFAEGGSFQVNGLQLALEDINKAGGILGRPVELRTEDNASTNPGTVLAFSKLFTDPAIKAIVGPIASTQIQAASPAIAKAGIPTMIGGTDPSLTRVNNKWVFRARPNDLYSSQGHRGLRRQHAEAEEVGDRARHRCVRSGRRQGAHRSAAGAGRDAGPRSGLHQQLAGLHADRARRQEIRRRSARHLHDGTGRPGDLREAAAPARREHSMGRVADHRHGDDANLAGEALYGTYAVADFNADANEAAREFTKRYRERYGIDPDNFASWAYDALHILALAMNNAKSTEPEAVRKAILAIKGYKGLEGTYEFDARGDGLHGYNVVKNDGGKIVFIKRVDFPVE